MKKRIGMVLLIVTACVAILLSGCGETKVSTLEDIASDNPELTKSIQKEISLPKGFSSDVSFSGDSFDIILKENEKLGKSETKALVKGFNKNTDAMDKICPKAIADMEDQTGITGIVCTIHIEDPDGNEIWSRSFDDSGSREK